MLVQLRHRLLNPNFYALLNYSPQNPHKTPKFSLSLRASISQKTNPQSTSTAKHSKPTATASKAARFARTVLFVPPGVEPDNIAEETILPDSNIVLGPYASDAKIKEVTFVKSSSRPKECPRDEMPEFAMLGRSNVRKSWSLTPWFAKRKSHSLRRS